MPAGGLRNECYPAGSLRIIAAFSNIWTASRIGRPPLADVVSASGCAQTVGSPAVSSAAVCVPPHSPRRFSRGSAKRPSSRSRRIRDVDCEHRLLPGSEPAPRSGRPSFERRRRDSGHERGLRAAGPLFDFGDISSGCRQRGQCGADGHGLARRVSLESFHVNAQGRTFGAGAGQPIRYSRLVGENDLRPHAQTPCRRRDRRSENRRHGGRAVRQSNDPRVSEDGRAAPPSFHGRSAREDPRSPAEHSSDGQTVASATA